MASDRVEHMVYESGAVRLEVSKLDGRVLRYCYLSHGDTYITLPTDDLTDVWQCVDDAMKDGLFHAVGVW